MRPFSWALAACWLAALLSATPARAEWRRAVSTHFIVYSEASQERLRETVERLERFDGWRRRISA